MKKIALITLGLFLATTQSTTHAMRVNPDIIKGSALLAAGFLSYGLGEKMWIDYRNMCQDYNENFYRPFAQDAQLATTNIAGSYALQMISLPLLVGGAWYLLKNLPNK